MAMMGASSFSALLRRIEQDGCCADSERYGYVSLDSDLHESPFAEAQGFDRSQEDQQNIEFDAMPPIAEDEDEEARNLRLQLTADEESRVLRSELSLHVHSIQPRIPRPPRELPGIACAAASFVAGACCGGLFGYELWALLQRTTARSCDGVQPLAFSKLGLDAARVVRVCSSLYCTHLRASPLVGAIAACVSALVAGLVVLRLSHGRAYFARWNEDESLAELQRLYCTRSYGGTLVLSSWRTWRMAVFSFHILVVMWLRYYLDVYMDVRAMKIFYYHHDPLFFTVNLSGMIISLLWTGMEIYKTLGKESTLPTKQIFIIGALLALGGLHVTYLVGISIYSGSMHPFLLLASVAEAILESPISSFVQTYAVVFHASELSWDSMMSLYQSIAVSFVSIGYAFSTLDRFDGGDILVKVPGLCHGFSPRWWAVLVFRIAEVTSRATSLALFQRALRRHSRFSIGFAVCVDCGILTVMAAASQYRIGRIGGAQDLLGFIVNNLVYVPPSVVCLMAPMLETDTVLTLSPPLFYAWRLISLILMALLMCWSLKWDLETAQDLFSDDGIIIGSFVWSTLLMFGMFVVIRGFLQVQVLLEAPAELWYARPFTTAQQVLRNRILVGHAGHDREQHGILQHLRKVPELSSSQHIKAALGSQRTGGCSHAEWAAKFLRAKVALFVEQALESLDATLSDNSTSPAAPLSLVPSPAVDALGSTKQDEVFAGSIVAICGRGGYLTASTSRTLMRLATEKSDQRFVVESVQERPIRERLCSGDFVLLRALKTGQLLGCSSHSRASAEQAAPPSLPYNIGLCSSNTRSQEAKFSINMVHAQSYSNAKRFLAGVKMLDGYSLLVHALSLRGTRADLTSTGWKILMVNGETATREIIDGIIAEGGGYDDLNLSDTISVMSGVGARPTPARSAQLVVLFEKVGGKCPIRTGDSIVLRAAGDEGWAQNVPISIWLPEGGDSTQATDASSSYQEGTRSASLIVTEDLPGSVLVLETVGFGSKDDSGVYGWAAREIARRREVRAQRASAAEKYRIATTAAFNARSLARTIPGVFQGHSELHKHCLLSLAHGIYWQQVYKLEYISQRALANELTLNRWAVGEPLLVTGVSTVGHTAQVGDEVLQIELMENGQTVACVVSCLDSHMDMRRALDRPGELILWLRSAALRAADTEVQRVAARHGGILAAVLPTWDEIMAEVNQQAHSPLQLLQLNGLFRGKCTLAADLLACGWTFEHEEFVGPAEKILGHFDAATRDRLKDSPQFQGIAEDVRDGLLVAQLDVLTTAWEAVPKLVKEQQGHTLRRLFRPDVELSVMRDAAVALYESWSVKVAQVFAAQGESQALPEMPEALYRFVSRMRPVDEEATVPGPTSASWLLQAWSEQREDSQQKVKVQEILTTFSKIFHGAEKYWSDHLTVAAEEMHEAQQSLESMLQSGSMDVQVVLISSGADLRNVQRCLNPDTLQLKSNLVIKDNLSSMTSSAGAVSVPKGLQMLRQGQLSDHFGNQKSLRAKDIHSKLMELAPKAGNDLRLFFGTDSFDAQLNEALQGLKDLGNLLQQVKRAAEVFPRVHRSYAQLHERYQEGRLKAVSFENERNVQLQSREAQEALRVATARLEILSQEKKQLQLDKDELNQLQQELMRTLGHPIDITSQSIGRGTHSYKTLMQGLFDHTFQDRPDRHLGGSGKHQPNQLNVVKVLQLPAGFRSVYREEYVAKREDIAITHPDIQQIASRSDVEHVDELTEELDDLVNEKYLFHATHPGVAEAILMTRVMVPTPAHRAAHGHMYGPGAYFAESSTKSDQYARPTSDGLYPMLVNRVVLGRVKTTTAEHPDADALTQECKSGQYDSVCGDRMNLRDGARAAKYREFVVYDESQSMPEYLVWYRRAGARRGRPG